ncbi:hypothetical protein [Sphingomonas sp. KC8]|uniref:hypothetical protein n=1 Tax=Sphingomonas sp. KC8 TaxID=1030157 RepID=UPI0002489436|nr:hypothetical protein [Sphingomonas sp. KC8]ARS27193.1 hypothetical protein KC8_07800 [Sphingomonas sp. KC8]
MRDTFSKLMTGAMVAGAALLVSACGSSETPATNTTELNAAEPSMEGSMNDVTAVDAAGASDNVVMDNAAVASDAATDNATAGNATNAM